MSEPLIPGEIKSSEGERMLNEGKKTKEIVMTNDGDRPIQIGSHFHLPDVNSAMSFDKEAAFGYHLDIPPGNSVRFEPGASRTVQIVELGGKKVVPGLQIKKDKQ